MSDTTPYDTSLVVSLYLVLTLAITTVCVLASPETSKADLHADPVDDSAGAWSVTNPEASSRRISPPLGPLPPA